MWPNALPLLTGGAGLLLASAAAHADPLVILGDADAVAAEARAAGAEVVPPDDARARLADLAPAADLAEPRGLAAEGREAYTATSFAAAAEKLRMAAALFLTAGVPEGSAPELARVYLDLGLVKLALGDERAAATDVTLALRIDPSLEVDRTAHGPPIRRFVDGLRAGAASTTRMTRVRFTSNPAGADVTIDGTSRGATPLEEELPAGPHLVVARLSGRLPEAQRIDVGTRPGAPVAIELRAEEPARAALAAIVAGDLEAAATQARAAFGGGIVVVVRGERAAVADGTGVRGVRGRTAAELAHAVLGDRSAGPPGHRTVDTRVRAIREPEALANAPARRASRERGGGLPAWIWIGGAAVLVAAATGAAIVATSSSDRVLVPRLE